MAFLSLPANLEWNIKADSIVTKPIGAGRAKSYVAEITNVVTHHFRLTVSPALRATISAQPDGTGLYVVRAVPNPPDTVENLIDEFRLCFPNNRFNQPTGQIIINGGSVIQKDPEVTLPKNMGWKEQEDNSLTSFATFSKDGAKAYAKRMQEEINTSEHALFSSASMSTKTDNKTDYYLVCTPHHWHAAADFITTFETVFGYQVSIGAQVVKGEVMVAPGLPEAEPEPTDLASVKWTASSSGNGANSEYYNEATALNLKSLLPSRTHTTRVVVGTLKLDPNSDPKKWCLNVVPKEAITELGIPVKPYQQSNLRP